MAIDYERLINRPFPVIEHAYSERDTMLYALGIGCGSDPCDAADLRYVYEGGLQAFPSMAAVLAHPGFWLKEPDTGVDWRQVLHGEQTIILHRPIPPAAKVRSQNQILDIVDLGRDKGALLLTKREILNGSEGNPFASLLSTTVLRGDGGFGGPSKQPDRSVTLPSTAPDIEVEMPTIPQAALLYRLSGDYNPLHADPLVAKAAGFDRPILHGMCTFGVVTRAIVKACCSAEAARLHSIKMRFSAPVFPGETISVQIWLSRYEIQFQAKARERNVVVIKGGHASVHNYSH